MCLQWAKPLQPASCSCFCSFFLLPCSPTPRFLCFSAAGAAAVSAPALHSNHILCAFPFQLVIGLLRYSVELLMKLQPKRKSWKAEKWMEKRVGFRCVCAAECVRHKAEEKPKIEKIEQCRKMINKLFELQLMAEKCVATQSEIEQDMAMTYIVFQFWVKFANDA